MPLTPDQRVRYERHIQLPEVGEEGQLRLFQSRVLLVGVGGLGSPVALYLAAAGIGTLGVVDDDVVQTSNLQRQVIHSVEGAPKVYSACGVTTALNPRLDFQAFEDRLDPSTVDRIFKSRWDVVVDAVDNLETRYLINEACVKRKIHWIHGAVSRYEGQLTTFNPKQGGPCYRCLYPDLSVLSKGPKKTGGVLGVVPGVIGVLQATEALKVILGLGQTLEGSMLNYDARYMSFHMLPLRDRNPNCPICSRDYNDGKDTTITLDQE